MRSILVPWWPGSTSISQLDAALAIARHVEAHLGVMFSRPTPDGLETTLQSAVSPPATLSLHMEPMIHEAGREARASFEAWRERNGIPGHIVNEQIRVPYAEWSERTGLPEELILRKGWLVDMTVLRFPTASDALDRPHDAAIFESGHPVLLVADQVGPAPLSHIVVAWNDSLHATRAVFGAMSLLRAADRVTVLTTTDLAPRPGEQGVAGDTDLVDALSWHGVKARHRKIDPGPSSVGPALLQEADELEATLLVMGAATSSRASIACPGGVTEHVFRNPPAIPVLMAH